MDKGYLEVKLSDGWSLKRIASEHGCSPGTVGYWVKRHGLEANGSRKFRPGKGLRREQLAPLVEAGLTLGQIATELRVGINTVRYWIAAYSMQTPREHRARDRAERLAAGDRKAIKPCRHHGSTEFVLDRRGSWRCRLCRQEAVSERRRNVKRTLVEEAGGACLLCGYDRYVGALQFHHLDPEAKRFALSIKGHTLGIERARIEASKCALLCANCHAEVEAGLAEVVFPPIVSTKVTT